MNNPMFSPAPGVPMQIPMMQPGAYQPYPATTAYPPPTSYSSQTVPQPAGMEWVWADTIADADRVYVAPGKTIYVMVRNAPVFVERTANASGNAVSSKAYQFSAMEQTENAKPAEPAPEYATVDAVKTLQKQMLELSEEVNALKGGIIRGKPVKQQSNAE